MTDPVIIEAAINGVTSKKQNPNTPKEPAEIADDALRCFRRTHMDVLVLENFILERSEQASMPVDDSWREEFALD